MYRIVLLLALVPGAAWCATPFVSLGVAPLVTILRYPTSTGGPPEFEDNFVAVGGAISAGLSGRAHEWYARFTWSNSRSSKHESRNDIHIENIAWALSKVERVARWQDQRLGVGYRWQPIRAEQKLIVGFIGVGATAGSSLWREDETQTSDVFYFETSEHVRDTTRSEISKYSLYSYGGLAEVGGRVSVRDNLFIETSAQFSFEHTVFRDHESDIGWWVNAAGTVIEPMWLFALRWEMR